MNNIAFDHQIFVNEISGVCTVRMNSANLGGGKDDHVRPFGLHEFTHIALIGKVQLSMRAGDDVRLAARLEPPQYRTANHAAMPCYIDFLHLCHLAFE